jgi:alpha-D-ribose 1-methylphosphonate 5-phosphate C-P lyase
MNPSAQFAFLLAGARIPLRPVKSTQMVVYQVPLPGRMFAQVVSLAPEMFAQVVTIL